MSSSSSNSVWMSEGMAEQAMLSKQERKKAEEARALEAMEAALRSATGLPKAKRDCARLLGEVLQGGYNEPTLRDFLLGEIVNSKELFLGASGKCAEWDQETRLWSVSEDRAPRGFTSRYLDDLKDLIPIPADGDAHKKLDAALNCARCAKQLNALESRIVTLLHKSQAYQRACEQLFSELDSTVHLIPLRDGTVLHSKTLQVEPRTKEHRFSRTFNAKYVEDTEHLRVDTFLRLIYGDALQYELERFGIGFSGDISAGQFHLGIGDKNNGKTTLAFFVCAVMNTFGADVEGSVFEYQSPDSRRASPHLVPIVKARICFSSETEVGAKMNEEQIKRWATDPWIMYRDLYEKGQRKSPNMCTHYFFCNKPPTFSSQEALGRRLVYHRFVTQFVDTPVHPWQCKGDPEMKSALSTDESARDYFFSICVRAARDFWARNGLHTDLPPSIQEYTKACIGENDSLSMFFSTCLVRDPKGEVRGEALQKKYIEWFDSMSLSCKREKPPAVKAAALRLPGCTFVTSNGARYRGYRFVEAPVQLASDPAFIAEASSEF